MSTLYVDNLQPNLGSRVMAAGHVVQVVTAETTTETVNNTTSYVDTTLSASITPTSASSKILVTVSAATFTESNVVQAFELDCKILRDNSLAKEFRRCIIIRAAPNNLFVGNGSQSTLVHLDSPATSSQITYKLQIRSSLSTAGARINKDNQATSTIMLQEIAQ